MKYFYFSFAFAFFFVIPSYIGQNVLPQPMPCHELSTSLPSGIVTAHSCIVDVGNNTTSQTITIGANNYTELKAGEEIFLDGEVLISPSPNVNNNGQNGFLGHLKASGIETVWYEPTNSPGQVGKYHKLELGFKLDADLEHDIKAYLNNWGGGSINPFDPAEMSMDIILTAPDGTITNTHGFYYESFNVDLANDKWTFDATDYYWRLRFAPDQIGDWTGEVIVNATGYPQMHSSFSFECVWSGHKGVLKTSNTGTVADRYLYQSDGDPGNTFVTIGHNISTRGTNAGPSRIAQQKQWMQELSAAGGNFFRTELYTGGGLPDWQEGWDGSTKSYPTGYEDVIYNYESKLDEMYGFDQIVDQAEIMDLYFIMFRHHVEASNPEDSPDEEWASWYWNPYKKAFNLTGSEQYFGNPQIKAIQKNCLRYVFARWGYSPRFSFYSYSEVNDWIHEMDDGMSNAAKYALWSTWTLEMRDYIKNQTHFRGGMFVNSSASTDATEIWQNTIITMLSDDIVSLHMYSEKKKMNFKSRADFIQSFLTYFPNYWGTTKPVVMEEMGPIVPHVYCCTGIDFHNAIWSTLFMGGMGTGMDWWWDRGIHDKGYFWDYLYIDNFLNGENLKTGKYSPQSWKDGIQSDLDDAKIENYALKSENKERVLGWVHNASYYWRNLYYDLPCIQELVDDNGELTNPCPLTFGAPSIGSITPDPDEINFQNVQFTDDFTDGGAQTFYNGQDFKINGLKFNVLQWLPNSKKHWYKTTFYRTQGVFSADPNVLFVDDRIDHTNILGILPINAPFFTPTNPDYSYKMEYLGFERYKPLGLKSSNGGSDFPTIGNNNFDKKLKSTRNIEVSETIEVSEDSEISDLIKIYPNPNMGDFEIQTDDYINSITIYNSLGISVYSKNKLHSKNIHVVLNHQAKGVYLVKFYCESFVGTKQFILE